MPDLNSIRMFHATLIIGCYLQRGGPKTPDRLMHSADAIIRSSCLPPPSFRPDGMIQVLR